jgi:antitoxin (DNA-binding transcriptional repressor) of toxin-antitoxin stability system
MESIAVSKFKATCLAVLQRVKKTGRPVRITRFGKAVADVVPPQAGQPEQPEQPEQGWIGVMVGRAEITGDIVGPALSASDWNALRS